MPIDGVSEIHNAKGKRRGCAPGPALWIILGSLLALGIKYLTGGL